MEVRRGRLEAEEEGNKSRIILACSAVGLPTRRQMARALDNIPFEYVVSPTCTEKSSMNNAHACRVALIMHVGRTNTVQKHTCQQFFC